MKTITKKNTLTALLTSFSFLLLSFSGTKGGEGFEIYLNSKLVLQQFGSQMNTVKSIELDKSVANSQLSVKYFHCGKIDKNRSITIKDANNTVLKEWRYADASAAGLSITDPAMVCKVSDILSLGKNNQGKLNLYYSSSELPQGRLLATLVLTADNLVKH
jgi:hypothetical protein